MAVVFIDRPPHSLDADTVIVTTTATGAREGVEHCYAIGHRRVAYLGDLTSITTAARALRWLRRRSDCGAQGSRWTSASCVRDLQRARARAGRARRRAIAPAAGRGTHGALPSQNLITIGAIQALRQGRGQRSVAIVGFDDIDLADTLIPGITVVAQDPYAMGRAAAELLFARIDGDRGQPS